LRVDKSLEGSGDYFLWEPDEVPMDHDGCKTLASAWKQTTGQDAVFSGFNAVCDATVFGKAGIPAVIFGPGDLSTGVHGPYERIAIDDLINCCKTYAAMAIDWCGVA
jgi:acetylornithine deacetylase/succinyl-diaminopimelate desuccinylase-like protein